MRFSFCISIHQDIFNESSGDDEDNINRKPSGSISNSASGDRRSELRDEISDRPKITNRTAIEDPTINTIFRQQAQPAARLVAANLFDSEPPELDDSPNMSSAQNAERKPVNLFSDDYDDDDDGFDIFAAKETESESAVGPANASKIDPKPMKSINLFDGDDENDDALFGGPAVVENKPKTSILSSMPPKNALFQNLFDDEPPEDDFDFLTKPSAAAIHRKEEVVIKNVVAEPEKVPEKKVLMDSVEPLSTPIKEKSPVKQLPSKINLFDDDFDEDDSFEKLIGSKIKNAIEKKTVLDVEQVSVRPNVTDEAEPPPLSKNLFDDESDPEDPFIAVPASTPKFSELDTKDDFLDPIPPPVKVEEKTPFNYASPLLFNDYPPDDDDDFVAMPTTETKQPGEFYNDFSETVTVPSAEATKSQYAYMFSDVPPPDDDLFQPVKTKKTIAKDSEFSKKLNAFANPDKVIDELPKAMTATNKPKKLKMGKLDINVAALLPGAKRTVSNIKSDAFSASNRSGDETENVMAPTIVKRVDVENVDDSGRLTNLTRNRAKVQTRRPSTRRGRQQQYQKSLEEKDDTEEKINDVAPEKENFSNKVPVVKEAVPAAPTSAETVEPEPLAFPVKIEDLIEPDELTTEIKSATEPIPTGTKEEANTGIRTEVDPSPTENSFPAVAEQQPPPLKSTDLAFLNESDDDALDDDDWLSNTMASTKNQSTKSKTSSEKASKTEFASSLFDDDEKFEWKADSPPPVSKTTANVNTISNIVFSSDKPPPLLESKSIFDDFEEPDDDDIFSPMKQQRPVPTVTSAPDPVTILAPAPNPVPDSAPTSVPTRQTKATSLFGDEDENDDDLFGKSAALPKVKRKVAARAAVQPSKSLFGDDMSDDDDLFGAPKTTKKDTKPAAAAGEQPTVLNSKQVTPGKLFSDSDGDGDDDLFGSKTKPTSIAATKSVPSTSTQNRITKAKASSVTDQDPLADLLK